MLLNGGELDGQRILGRKSVELMTVDPLGDVTFAEGDGFGLGFYIVEDSGARGETRVGWRVWLGRRVTQPVLG
jgi:CubicO group peptidase (beta-lactamase class C family)